jgi:hypothetical protein
MVLATETPFYTALKNATGSPGVSLCSPGSGLAAAFISDIGNFDLFVDAWTATGAVLHPVYQLYT